MQENDYVGLAQVGSQIERLTREQCEAEQDLAPKYAPIPGDAKKRMMLIKHDGTFTVEEPIPGYLDLVFETPQDLKRYIVETRNLNIQSIEPSTQAIFLTEKAVVYIPNLNDRRDKATCPLPKSLVWKVLESNSGNGPPAMSQKDFIRLLRVTFRGCITDGNPLLSLVKNVKYNNSGQMEANLQHGNESLGKSVVNQAMGTTDFPEEIGLIVQPFENVPFKAQVPCAVEIDPEARTFKLTPYPLMMKEVLDEALATVASVFNEEDSMPPVYRGAP